MKDPNENRPGYKETKVGWIPEEWNVSRLGSVRSYLGSGISRPFFDDPSQGIPVLRSNNVQDGHVVPNDLKYWHDPDPRGADLETARPQSGDILINFVNGSRKELGKAGVYAGFPTECIVSTNFFIFRPDQNAACSNFLAYHFAGDDYRRWLHRIVGFSGPGSFNQQQITSHLVPLPPLPEQQKIAEILSTWDEAIEQTRKLIDAKKRRKKGLMQQLLTPPVAGQSGKKRLPGFSCEWKTHTLGTLFKERCETGREDLPLLAITGSRGVISADEIERKDSSSADKSRYKRIAVGDIGYNTMRMWQGVNALSTLEGIVSPAYTICTPSEKLCGKFLSYYFKFRPVVHWFYRYSQGLVSDTWNLKFPHFAQISLPFPAKDEQKAIASVLKAADDEIACHEAELRALEKQKRGLMQKLLTGTVRVKI